MKKFKLFSVIIILSSTFASGQNIKIKGDTAYIDKLPYVKIEMVKENKYFIRSVDNNRKLLRIKLVEAFNRLDQRTDKLPSVYSYRDKRKSKYEIDIQSEVELIEFIYSKKFVPLSKYSKNKR